MDYSRVDLELPYGHHRDNKYDETSFQSLRDTKKRLNDLIKNVAGKEGISDDHAQKAVDAVVGF